MEERKQGARIVKNVGIWRRNEPLGKSASRVCRAHSCLQIHPSVTFVHCASHVALLPPLTRSLRREDRLAVLSDREQRQVDRLRE